MDNMSRGGAPVAQRPRPMVGTVGSSAAATGSRITQPSAASLLDSTAPAPDGAPVPRASGDTGSGFVQASATSLLWEAGVGVTPFAVTQPGDNSNVISGQGDIGFPRAADGPGTGLVTKPGVMGQTKSRHKGGALPPGFQGAR